MPLPGVFLHPDVPGFVHVRAGEELQVCRLRDRRARLSGDPAGGVECACGGGERQQERADARAWLHADDDPQHHSQDAFAAGKIAERQPGQPAIAEPVRCFNLAQDV